MASILKGDFSKYPEPIRKVFPRLAGEALYLQEQWRIYEDFFMLDPKRTETYSKSFGPLLGLLQTLLQDELFLIISRLTDKDSRSQKNLSLWCLEEAIPFSKRQEFKAEVENALNDIFATAASLRKHRHKRIAHFDRETSLKLVALPKVTFRQINEVIVKIHSLLSLFYAEFENTSMLFDMANSNLAGLAWIVALKIKAYDQLEAEGLIPKLEWLRREKGFKI